MALCLQYFRCWVIFVLSNSPLQKLHIPIEITFVAGVFAILYSSTPLSPHLLEFVTQCLIHYTTPWFLSFKVTVAAKPSSTLAVDRDLKYARNGGDSAWNDSQQGPRVVQASLSPGYLY